MYRKADRSMIGYVEKYSYIIVFGRYLQQAEQLKNNFVNWWLPKTSNIWIDVRGN